MTDETNQRFSIAAPAARHRSRFKERFLAEHGDGPNTREVFRLFDENCARVQATCDLIPVRKTRSPGSMRKLEF